MIRNYNHLQGVKIDDSDTKDQLPIHVVLGNGEYARIKTSTKPLVGGDRELGWFIMSSGIDFYRTTQSDLENLCRLDVPGLADSMENDQSLMYEDFKEQLVRNPAGWYEINLTWKANHPTLLTNKAGSRRRLNSLVKRLTRDGN